METRKFALTRKYINYITCISSVGCVPHKATAHTCKFMEESTYLTYVCKLTRVNTSSFFKNSNLWLGVLVSVLNPSMWKTEVGRCT